MRLCPACGNEYPDDANFCPMDASRLPPPLSVTESAATVMDMPAAKVIGGRYLLKGAGVKTPTGEQTPARDMQGQADVSVKIVDATVLPNQPMIDRAQRELKQLSKLTSERILRVLDQGRTDDGRLFVVTEPPAGQTLEQLVRQGGPLPVARAKAIVLQVGEALIEAQKVGVIHRDVAPRNIWVQDGDRTKLADFGLAEPITESVFGSPAFLSPEQAEGKAVDQRSNIYSLAATLYFAVTGVPPFEGNASSLLQQHVNAQPIVPSARRTDLSLSGSLDRVILKALDKSGGRRHLTLRQLLNEIDELPNTFEKSPPAEINSGATQDNSSRSTVFGMPSPFLGGNIPPVVASAPVAVEAAPVVSPKVAEPAAAAPVVAPVFAPVVESPVTAKSVEKPAPVVEKRPAPAPVVAAPIAAAPSTAAPASAPAASPPAASVPSGPGKPGFRETAWFKKGEIEEELAKSQAKVATEDPLAASGATGVMPAVDENQLAKNLSAEDRKRLSLKTGATQMMSAVKVPVKAVPVPDRMNEDEMLAEMNPAKKWVMPVAGLVVAVIITVVVLALRH